jgi:glycolate oxidase iron-sulfur subunit
MSKHKEIEDYRDEIKQCVKCGTCRAHCPVFAQLQKEPVVARGKVSLAQALLDDDIDLDQALVTDISQCLACGRCVKECPNLVPTDEIILALRRRIAKRKGLTLFGRGISTVLQRPRLMELLTGLGRAFSWLLFRRVPKGSGLRLRFPAPYIRRDRTIPQLAHPPFRRRHPEFIAGHADRPRVAFFTGCMINHVFPEIGDSVLTALQALGMNIAIPADQGCCGLPALCAGDGKGAARLADRNLAALTAAQPDVIVTACASCHSGLTKYFRQLGPDHERLADKVVDIHAFLERQGLVEQLRELPRQDRQRAVAYHVPCHLRQPEQVDAPRRLLKALPSVRFVDMAHADACCGLGGTFSVYHYDISTAIGAQKAEGVRASEAEMVATACPGCIMQLQDILNHAGLPHQVAHVLELVADELQKAGSNAEPDRARPQK